MPAIRRYTMYCISLFHYLVKGLLTNAVAETNLVRAANEYLRFDWDNLRAIPPSNNLQWLRQDTFWILMLLGIVNSAQPATRVHS